MQSDTNVQVSQEQVLEDVQLFLEVLPDPLRAAIEKTGRQDELLEVVMDLGRPPSARFVDGEIELRDAGVTESEIQHIGEGLSNFDDDNRAGIARTLHRIAGIRNRRGKVIGLTCRIGRPVYGTLDIIADIVSEGASLLLLGAPGVGKTTMLREVARIVSAEKRVVIVDTSNEIGGDGDIPHRAVGRARRMQVPKPSHQHETMIEAVENHNPEVIIIDEIGREEEAAAARTINERGVRLVGTAHGRSLENLLLNPTLSDLIGGIESVTLSDEEARRRGTQKTVLERRAPPTFDMLIEIQERQRLVIHRDVAASVDAMLRGRALNVELRYRDEDGQIQIESQLQNSSTSAVNGRRRDIPAEAEAPPARSKNGKAKKQSKKADKQATTTGAQAVAKADAKVGKRDLVEGDSAEPALPEKRTVTIYSYGVARNRLVDAGKRLGVEIETVDRLQDADMMVTLKSYYRKHRRLIQDAERQQKPVYVLRANTVNQMETFLTDALHLETIPADPFEAAIADAAQGIEKVRNGEPSVDLAPAGAAIRRYQHQMARQADLVAHSYGREPNRHVRVFNMQRNESTPAVD